MDWFPVALTAAFFTATTDAILKAKYSRAGAVRMAMVRSVAPVPFLLPLLFLVPRPETGPVFWQTVGLLLPLEILALLLYMKALQVSPLSLSIPFLAFTPAFMVLTGWVVLGERVTRTGLFGIGAVVAGAYVLHIDTKVRGLLSPFRNIAKEKGSMLMLAVACIYSITSVLGKRAVLESEPVFFACFYFVLLAVATPFVLVFYEVLGRSNTLSGARTFLLKIDCGWWAWWAVGATQAVMVLAHMWAISLTNAAYMIAVKRTSLIMSVLFGRLFFAEENTTQRLLGVMLMFTGAVLLYIAG